MRRLILLAAVVAALAACGKKADLRQPDGAKPTFPKTYPTR